MRQRVDRRLTDRATIKRDSQTGTNELGEPILEETTIAADVPCSFTPQSTSFVREDSGERVQRPAEVRLRADANIKAGDTIEIDSESTTFEVRGVREAPDHRRARTVYQRVEVERA